MQAALGALAASWGVLMAISPGLQIRRMYVTRSSRDVSVGYYLVLVPGFALWVAYGVDIGNPVIAVPNAVALVVALILIAVASALPRNAGR